MSFTLESLPSAETIAANVVVFCGAIAAAVLGGLQAAKKIKEGWVDAFGRGAKGGEVTKTVTTQQVLGGLLQDTYGSAMMSDQVRLLTAAIERLTHEIEHNTDATKESTRATCEQREEMRELRHQVERFSDKWRT